MKRIILALIFLITMPSVWGQPDKGSKTVIIPRLLDPEKNISKTPAIRQQETKEESKFNTFDFKPIELKSDFKLERPNSGYTIGDGDKNKFNSEEKFQAPYKISREIVINTYVNEDDSKIFRRNQSFGELRTKSNSVKLMFKDYAAVDGDRIKIMVNGLTVRADATLIEVFQTVEIGLTPGFNKVEFEALNQGYSGPNTAQFKIVDDAGKQLIDNRWDLATGFKASIMIIKE